VSEGSRPEAVAAPYGRELEVALEVLAAAGAEVLRRYQAWTPIPDAPAEITTEADLASQEVILEGLQRAFPADGICAEEATAGRARSPRNTRRFWVVDPIDGTRGFARKNGEFSIMVALVSEGRPVVGAVLEPAPGRLTWAVAGQGCWARRGHEPPARCRVTATRGTPRVLSMSRSRGPEATRELLAALGGVEALHTFSAGIKLAQVARGEADLYLGDYLTLKDWDVCAGHILVEEAGGTVTDVDGRPVRYDGSGRSLGGRGLLASNGGTHSRALEALAADLVPW
jgi:3'(2'), 5'-bisphosphate nucleotidase